MNASVSAFVLSFVCGC